MAVSAPSNVSLDTSVEDEITVSWDSVSDADSYNVYRATSSGSSTSDYTEVASGLSSSTTSYTDTSLSDGEKYYYRVESASSGTVDGSSTLRTFDNSTDVNTGPSGIEFTANVDLVGLEATVSANCDSFNTFNGRIEDTNSNVIDSASNLTADSTVTFSGNLNAGQTYRLLIESDDGSDISIGYFDSASLPTNEGDYTIEAGYSLGFTRTSNFYAWNDIVAKKEGDETALSNEVNGVTVLPAPSNVSGSTTTSSIDLSWNDNSDNENGFDVFRDSSNIATVSANTTSYSDTGLSSNTSYNYVIQSYTSHTSTSSGTNTITTDPNAPTAPSSLSASVSGTDISLNWNSSDFDGDSGHYDVYRGTSSGSHTQIAEVSKGTTSYTDTGLSEGEQYYYVVDATNSGGTSSDSNEVSPTTELPAPTNFSGTASGNDVSLSWTDNASDENGYDIARDGTNIASLSANTTSYSDTGLSYSTTYNYEVTAFTSDATASDTTSVTTEADVSAPSTPQNLSASATNDDISLNWDAVNWNGDEGNYEVYRGQSSGSVTTNIASVPSGTTSYTDTGLSDGEQYYYEVAATNSGGTSSRSNTANATTSLPAPSNLSATAASDSSIDLSWTDNSDNEDGFDIYRNGSFHDNVTANTTSYTDTGLSSNTSYSYEVEAYTEHRTSISGTASATTDYSAPTAPSNLSASVSADDISLSWSSSDFDGDNGHYDVYRGTSSGSHSQITQVSKGTTTYTDFSLNDGETYYYVVDATNSGGTSADSNEASALTSLPAPSGTSATAAGTSQIDLSWTDNSDNEDGFEIFRGTSSGSLSSLTTVSSNTTTYSDTGLSSDTTYYYQIESYTEHTASAGSEVSSTTDPEISAPTNIQISDSSTEDELTLNWDEATAANGYYVYRAESSGSTVGDYTQVADVTAPPYTDTSLEDGEKYFYRISSHD